MSEPVSENPSQADQQPVEQTQETQTPATQPQSSGSGSEVQEIPLRLVKRPTGDTHFNTAKGIWETVVHAETGEPSQEYVLLATIDGQEVPLESYNAGRLETQARSLNQSQQSQPSEV